MKFGYNFLFLLITKIMNDPQILCGAVFDIEVPNLQISSNLESNLVYLGSVCFTVCFIMTR